MTPEPTKLDALAGSVSDGGAVDWQVAESGAVDAREQASIRALREVAQIAEFSRTLQRSSPPAAAQTLEPARWGDLLLLEQVGEGTSGVVWRAWDPRLQREVDRKSTRLNSSHSELSRMPSSA